MRHDSNRRPTASSPIPVIAFVDWNAQMHNAGALEAEPHERARRTLQRTARVIVRVLAQQAPASRFGVVFRLYHGWYRSWEQTENFRAITTVVSKTDFSDLAQTQHNVRFSTDVQYGHALLQALPRRRHAHPPIHLPNTLRRQRRESGPTEKMVDTALAADLLVWARDDRSEWALILSEDDDMVPPVFTAEAWIERHGGRVLIVRARRPDRNFLKLDGLVVEVKQ